MGRLERNAAAVGRYLEIVHHKLERAIVGSDEPYDRKAKGSSRPPFTDAALKLSRANRHASRILEPLLGEIKGREDAYAGVEFRDLLARVRYDPGAARNWRHGETGRDRADAEAWWKMCLLVARTAMIRWDAAEIAEMHAPAPGEAEQKRVVKPSDVPLDLSELVRTDPEDEEARPKTREAQKIDTRHANRRIVEAIEKTEREHQCSRGAAMGLLADTMQWSIPRQRKAVEQVNRERGEGAA